MHLLAGKPGGFVDDEGIVDLAQAPADIIIMSAADSSLAAIASAVDGICLDFPSVRLVNWMQLLKPAAFDLYRNNTLSCCKVVVVSLLGGASYWPYGFEQLQQWQTEAAERTLIFVPGDDAEDQSLWQASSTPEGSAQRVWRYLRQGGVANNSHLLRFLAAEYLGRAVSWREPEILPRCMIYMPGSSLKHGQATLADWRARWGQRKDAVCVLLFYRSHLQSGNTAMFDELIAALERPGLQPLPIAITSLKDPESRLLVNAIVDQARAKLILNTTGFASNKATCPELASHPTDFDRAFDKPIPVLQLVLSGSTKEDWQGSSQGLRARDIAMQVVLPEMDGRIITRALSFKMEAFWSERCQASLVRYQLHRERADFIAQLTASYLNLASKPNNKKRLAIILANYPTKDGRIGNGVGLDTPASTVKLLTALAAAGYPLRHVPSTGNALIEALLGAVTNNPNTLHQRACWQSISLERYQKYFALMPGQNQRAVMEQWGGPDSDPKFRNGRLMIAGIRLGETFVGIQPARGFNRDLTANYHDPDLVPPHSYLAFYFWLRHEYKVDAVVHMGKHGNLEWLPGKSTALSNSCWPDIALGPLPHFYPFIVNDPGEGAQAKRRAHAVIIDHLMPPMARAEVYGELADLEALVDEYYQAMAIDPRREQWLKQKILSHLQDTHILQELHGAHTSNDNSLLSQLDTYLCDIKEAQIRHGLHILGELPNTQKLADTLVALLRLPRGLKTPEQGVLSNLVHDLQCKHKNELFDPLQFEVEPWQGPKSELLLALDTRPWRTTADARARLEILAVQLIAGYVLHSSQPDNGLLKPAVLSEPSVCNGSVGAAQKQSTTAALQAMDYAEFQRVLPRSAEQLQYAKTVLCRALNKSVELEIQSLLNGLAGQFVEPGPSGAPTRGRLDTLPTGRNFYSVDNRSIPSTAAWALGQLSAQALIERHLQEHGDYPRDLGLSVWGTATMRTGGDDIAQAFALMGVKPVWALGSQRVIDIEIIPCMLLNRPRVDVTLRVSGFFRDAFPNVVRLFDTAVQALADYEDPGGLNTIRQHIHQREQWLAANGAPPAQTRREASYRVFGSKPGAYGAGLQGLIDERCWQGRDDLAQAYLNWGGYAYGADDLSKEGVEARHSFKYRLEQLDVVVQNQDNREHDVLDSDDYYQFQGGMTNAATVYSGKVPSVYHNDHSNPSQPKVRTLKEELNRVIRSRVLNPKWIEAMREHGYKGAFEMAASVDYLFAYDATTELIDDYQYEKVTQALVMDPKNRQFLSANNPAALEEIAERLLEAVQRGLWQAPGDYAEQLQDILLQIDAVQEEQGAPASR